jgi:hypothetical protein
MSLSSTIREVNGTVVAPFTRQVDIVQLGACLVLVLAATGMWHLILERLER